MSAAAIVALVLALMPGATGDQPTVSSLRMNADGSAAGAVTATRAQARPPRVLCAGSAPSPAPGLSAPCAAPSTPSAAAT